MTNKVIIASSVLAVGLLALGLCIRGGLKSFNDSQRIVEVRGLSEREVPADQVTWPISFKLTGNELPAVYAQVSSTNNVIVEFLRANSIAEKDISVSAPQVNDLSADRYNSQPIPFNYSVTSVVTVSSSQVDKVRQLINRQGELLQKGIPISTDYSNPITYKFTGLNSIKPEMIAEATKNAREAAEKFANDSESKIGKIKEARQGQFEVNDRDNYTPYIKTVRVVTKLVYYLED